MTNCQPTIEKKLTKSITWSESTKKCRLVVSYGMTYIPGKPQPYFSITASEEYMTRVGWRTRACGCMHDEIAKKFPQLAPLIWHHLCGQDGLPTHYIANAQYWFKQRKWDTLLEHIRWDADEESENDPRDMEYDVFCQWLENRIPMLKNEFDATMSLYGIEYIDI